MELKYVRGNIEIKDGSHRHVVVSAKTMTNFLGEEINIAASDLTNEKQLIQDIATATRDFPDSEEVFSFNTNLPVSLSETFTGVEKAFVDAIKSYDNGLFVELLNLESLKDEPDSIEKRSVPQRVVKLIDGKYTEITEDVLVNVIDEHPVFKDGVDTGRKIPVSRVKKGKKVSKKNKDRLKDLKVIRDAL